MKEIETTLLLLRRNDEILLALKKRGFGEGKYNGVGGKLEKDETPDMAMLRETQEEILITPTKYEKVAIIDFLEYVKGEKTKLRFHLYVATEWDKEPSESDEMIPKWFKIKDIPYNQMFPDDKYWLPMILEGKRIKGFFEFDENWNLISKTIEDFKD